MRKLLLLAIWITISASGLAQNTGLMQGLNFRIDYDKQRENALRIYELDREAYYDYVEKVKVQYNNLQSLYKYQTSYSSVSDGWKDVVATNGYDLFATRKVYVENGIVTRYLNGENNELTISNGGKIIDEKTVVSLKETNNNVVELYFGFKLN